MAPVDDGGGPSPEYTSPDTEVSPANLDSFADYLDDLARNWNDDGETGYARKVERQLEGDEDWPKFGTFEAAQSVAQRYSQTHQNMITTAGQIHATLTSLATATRKIANNYKNAEELSNASVGEVEQLLDEHVDPGPGPGQTDGQGDGTNPDTDPTNGGQDGDRDPE